MKLELQHLKEIEEMDEEYTSSDDSYSDEDEDLDSFDLTIDETLQMIKEGIIYDSKSVALIMLLKDKLISIKK